jgi:hypothetical protein
MFSLPGPISRGLGAFRRNVVLVWPHITVFFVTIVGCAAGYYFLTPGGNGLASNGKALEKTEIGNAVYFSIVTISSLGYGDLHPVGYSKAIVSFEVMLGLVLMGLMLARLTSSLLSFQVTELYGAEQERKLEALAVKCEGLNEDLQDVFEKVSAAAAPVPGSKSSALPTQRFRSTLGRMGSITLQAHTLVLRGAPGSLLKIASGEMLLRTGIALNQGTFILSQTMLTLIGSQKTATLDVAVRTEITGIANRLDDLCRHVERESDDDHVKSQFVQIRESSKQVRRAIYASKSPTQPEQPDQQLSLPPEAGPEKEAR